MALQYTTTHEWIRKDEKDGDTYVIGISDHAQNQLSDVVFVDLPEPGTQVEAGQTMLSIDSVKAASDIYAPMTGEILEINAALADNPALVNTSPENDGWLVKLKSSNPDLSALLTAEAYAEEVAKAEG